MLHRIALLTAVVLGTGCTPKVGITRFRPSEVNLQPVRQISVEVDSEGQTLMGAVLDIVASWHDEHPDPAYAVADVRSALEEQIGRDGFFAISDPANAGATVRVELKNYSQKLTSEKSDKEETFTLSGTLDATTTVTRPNQNPVRVTQSASKEISLQNSDDAGNAAPELLRALAAELAKQVAYAITPVEYEETVSLDDSDERVKRAIDLVKQEKFDDAWVELNALAEKDPACAAAHYNLGVIEEARANLTAAKARYQRAQELKPSSLHAEAVERIDRASNECRALGCAAK